MLDDALKDSTPFAPVFGREDGERPEWVVESAPVPYPVAVAEMEARVAAIHAGEARERIWLIEHPPLYTAGVSAKAEDLLMSDKFDVFKTDRGGQYTYHGPGQRVVYVMLDLNKRRKDVRALVETLEHWIIDTLWTFNVEGHIREGRVGVWVERRDQPSIAAPPPFDALASEGGKADWPPEPLRGPLHKEDKIAAIGIKLRRWVSFHGISLNVEPDLSHFGGIVPCGITQHGVTSLVDLGLPVTMDEVDYALRTAFEAHFGPVEAVQSAFRKV